ncbi:MAG: SH3 domain-containing protein [Thermodesulfobacteriota bacterium]
MTAIKTPLIRFSFLFIVSLCLTLVSHTAWAETVSVTKDGVNIRIGPSTDSAVYMEVFQGYPLKVLNKKGKWLKVTDFEGDTGWIYASLVKPGNTVIVNSQSTINMRSGPSTGNNIIANVERGVVLTRLSKKGKWVKVKHSRGTVGWVYQPLLWP